MKRLFFLFVFIFIGFGAFGQMDVGQYNYHIYSSLTDTIPPSSKKEKKTLPDGRHKEVLIISLKLQNTTLQDDEVGAVLYSGYGGGFNIGYERLGKLYLYAALDMDILASLRPGNRHQRELFDDLDFLGNANYNRLRFGPVIAGYNIKNSHHYLGLSFEGQFQRNEYPTFDYVLENIIAYAGLSYVYFGQVRKIPFDVNVNFPVIITPTVVETPRRNFTDYFNPTLKIDFMPFRSFRNSDNTNIELSYACEYLNYYRYRDTRYRYRQLINSFSIGINYKIDTNADSYYQPNYPYY